MPGRDASHPFTIVAVTPTNAVLEQDAPPDRLERRKALYRRMMPDAEIHVRVNCPALPSPAPASRTRVRIGVRHARP